MKPRRVPLLATAGAAGLVLVVGGTDLVVSHLADERIARAVACRLTTKGPVDVDLGAFAGLTALAGHLGTTHVSAKDVQRQDIALDVSVTLDGLTTKGAYDGGAARATIPFDELDKRIGGGASGGGSGKGSGAGSAVTAGVEGNDLVLRTRMGGLGLSVTVRTAVTTTADSVTITPTAVSVLGRTIPVDQLPPGASGLSSRLKPHTVKVPVPQGAALTGAHADRSGLVLTFHLAASSTRSGGGKGGSGACAAGHPPVSPG